MTPERLDGAMTRLAYLFLFLTAIYFAGHVAVALLR